MNKPINQKSYPTVKHVVGSNNGPADKTLNEGQNKILTQTARKKSGQPYKITIQEKLDGSNVSIANVNGEIIPLMKYGHKAETSPYTQLNWFHQWVKSFDDQKWKEIIKPGERLCGEWMVIAHGIIYDMEYIKHPFIPFDIMKNDGHERVIFDEFHSRIMDSRIELCMPIGKVFNKGETIGPKEAYGFICGLKATGQYQFGPYAETKPEGVIYRAEQDGKTKFLGKYVNHDFEAGRYLSGLNSNNQIGHVFNKNVLRFI